MSLTPHGPRTLSKQVYLQIKCISRISAMQITCGRGQSYSAPWLSTGHCTCQKVIEQKEDSSNRTIREKNTRLYSKTRRGNHLYMHSSRIRRKSKQTCQTELARSSSKHLCAVANQLQCSVRLSSYNATQGARQL